MKNKVLIIAEAGVNHNGNYDLAIRLIDEAKKAGADIVKFQTAVPELVMSKYAEKADYQKVATGEAGSQLEMAKKIRKDVFMETITMNHNSRLLRMYLSSTSIQ